MRCDKAKPLLNRLLDGELDRWTAGRVRRHLAACPGCRAACREIEALGAAARAWRNETAPPALKSRIGAALAAPPRAAATEPAASTAPGGRALDRKEWFTMPIARWGFVGITAAALALLWAGSQRSDVALAAVIRAAEAVHAAHFVGDGSRGTHAEGWWVDGVGARIRIQQGRNEQLEVDDMKQRYVYSVRERPAPQPAGEKPTSGPSGIPSGAPALERRVEVGPSGMADPKAREATREQSTFAGILRQLERRHRPRDIESGWAVLNGRRLRRITAKGESQVFYVDPAMQRLVVWEDWGGYVGPRDEYMRIRIDYPDPGSVDRRLFQFQPPPGVPVQRMAPAPPRRQRPLSRQEKVWLGQQQLLNQCLSHMSELREALRRYANDHHGQWPPSLIPYLDPYVKGREVFRCPADHGPGKSTYVYHRLTGTAAAAALKTMNETAPTTTPPRPGTPVLLDCPHHPRWIWHIDARANTFGRPPAAPH